MRQLVRFIPFWRLTRWGWLRQALRLTDSCDEWHNPSHYFIVPMVGELIVFDHGYDISGPVHLYAQGSEGWLGADVPGCEICIEIKKELSW